MGIFTEDKGYKKINGKTFELRKKSKSKKKLKKKGKNLKQSYLSSVSNYRIKKVGKKYGLYVR